MYAMLADVAARRCDAGALRQFAPLAEQTAARDEHALYQAIAHRAWGVAHRLAGEYSESEARLNKALNVFETYQARWQMGRTLHELTELAVARNDMVEAHAYHDRSLAMYEAQGARPDMMRIQAALSS
jgi:hypothetical protein